MVVATEDGPELVSVAEATSENEHAGSVGRHLGDSSIG